MTEKTDTNWQDIGDWKNGRVHSGARALIWVSLLFGVAFTGLSLPGVLAIPEEIGKGNGSVSFYWYCCFLLLALPHSHCLSIA